MLEPRACVEDLEWCRAGSFHLSAWFYCVPFPKCVSNSNSSGCPSPSLWLASLSAALLEGKSGQPCLSIGFLSLDSTIWKCKVFWENDIYIEHVKTFSCHFHKCSAALQPLRGICMLFYMIQGRYVRICIGFVQTLSFSKGLTWTSADWCTQEVTNWSLWCWRLFVCE